MDHFHHPGVRKNVRRFRARAKRWAKRLLLAAVLFLAAAAGVVYAFRGQLADEMRKQLAAGLGRSGIHAEYTLNDARPWRGLELGDLIIHARPDLESPVLGISRIRIHFNLLGLLLGGESAAAHVTAQETDLTLWHEGVGHDVSGFSLDARADGLGLGVSRLRLAFRDLLLEGTGDLRWKNMPKEERADEEKSGQQEDGRGRREFSLGPWAAWLDAIPDTPDGEILLSAIFDFTGNPADPGTVEVTVKGERVNWEDLSLEDVEARLDLTLPRDGSLPSVAFPQVSFRFGEGSLSAAGAWNLEEDRMELAELESSVDLRDFLAALGRELPATVPYLPGLRVSATGVARPGDFLASDLSGELESEGPLTLPLEGAAALVLADLSASFSLAQGQLTLSGLRAVLPAEDPPWELSGGLSLPLGEASTLVEFLGTSLRRGEEEISWDGSLALPSGVLSLDRMESSADFRSLFRALGLLDPVPASLSWSQPPRISLSGRVPLASPLDSSLQGNLLASGPVAVALGSEGRSLEWRELAAPGFILEERTLTLPSLSAATGPAADPAALSATLSASFPAGSPASIQITEIAVTRNSAAATLAGELTLAPASLQITRFVSDMDLIALAVDMGFTEGSSAFSFPAAPRMELAGRLNPASPVAGSDLSGTLELPEGFSLSLPEGRAWRVTLLETSFTLKEGLLSTPDLNALTLGGNLVLNGSARLGNDPLPFGASLRLTDASMEEISRTLGLDETRTGQLGMEFVGKGTPSLAGIEGQGVVSVTGAKFVTLPLYRDLRPLLAVLTPGSWGGDTGSSLNATFAMGGGLLTSEDIRVDAGLVTIDSAALVDFNETQIKATGAVAGSGVTRVFTELAGKVLEVEGTGPFGDIRWRLKNAPGIEAVEDLVGLPADLLRATLSRAASPVETFREATGAARDALEGASGTARDAIGGAAGLGRRILRSPFGREPSRPPAEQAPPPAQEAPAENPPAENPPAENPP